jgi:single-stranded DNA-binding protein
MRPWTDNTGAERQSLEVDVREFAFVGGGKSEQQSAPAPQRPTSDRMDAQNRASMAAQAPAGSGYDDGSEIPFNSHERGWIA